ncbi:MAG: elongation factor P [bacterium]|nr:elongation factor P [bacterium]
MALLPSLNSIRIGMTLLVDGEPYRVVLANFSRQQQRKPVMQSKLKSLISGKVIEINFKPGDRIEEADLEKTKADFLYTDHTGIHFMDTSSYEQFSIDADVLGDKVKLLKEGTSVEVLLFRERPISVDLPPKINLRVESAPPGIKGDSSGGVTKPVTLETGLVINTPLFVKEGDVIKINTETMEYVERA